MKKIVVAESSPTIKSVADTLLRKNGYDVVCTSDGLQAWEVINSSRPDLVLTGLNLSGITGLELCRQMAGDGLTGGIPVVVLVGKKDKVSSDELKSSGVKGKLQKPFSPRDLLAVVTKLIGKGEKVSQVAVSKIAAGKANSGAQFQPTKRLHEDGKSDFYNLDWTDLNDMGESKEEGIKNKISAGGHLDDQGIIIEDDQFGLVPLNIGDDEEDQQPQSESSGDEDYNWFIGEMKKENSGERVAEPEESESPEEEPAPDETDSPAIDDEEINFEDFQTAGEKMIKPQEAPIAKKEPPKSSAKVEKVPEKQTLSDEEISRIADKVVQNLASALAAKIDRQQILDAIKSIVK